MIPEGHMPKRTRKSKSRRVRDRKFYTTKYLCDNMSQEIGGKITGKRVLQPLSMAMVVVKGET